VRVQADRPAIEIRVPATSWGPTLARRFVAARLHEHAVAPEVIAAATLVVSELVNYSVVHAACSAPLVVRVETTDHQVTVAVVDRISAIPSTLPARTPASHRRGRSLPLLDRLSDGWGVDLRDGERAVWCSFNR
jgi:anti-sigma regulatory factor (Ser/Thr protein kinase)